MRRGSIRFRPCRSASTPSKWNKPASLPSRTTFSSMSVKRGARIFTCRSDPRSRPSRCRQTPACCLRMTPLSAPLWVCRPSSRPRSTCATGTTYCAPCPESRSADTPSRAATPPPGARAISMSTACTHCKTISSWTASTTTHSQRTCRNSARRRRIPRST